MKTYEATEQSYKNGYKKGYEDGVKEFAEMLKEHSHDIVLYGEIVTVSRIDSIAEEMVGEKDA